MKRKMPLIFLVLTLLGGVVGGTYAYYSAAKQFDNKLNVGNFDVVIDETYTEADIGLPNNGGTNTFSKIVNIENKETSAAIVRISYNEYLETIGSYHEAYNADETEYKVLDNLYCKDTSNSYVSIKNWTEEFDNFIYKDGWYYYTKILPAKTSIQILESVTITTSCIPLYEKYNLDFNLEAIQASNDAVQALWGYNIEISESGDVDWNF